MGTWGTGIFSDDTASDLRSSYRGMLESGADDAQVVQDLLASYGDDPVVWLALAAIQSRLGRVDPVVSARAIEIIDTGEDLAAWDDSAPADRRARQRVLLSLRDALTGPQPPRKEIARKWRHHTDLQVGDVLTATLGSVSSLWLVVEVVADPVFGAHPMIRRLTHDDGPFPVSAGELSEQMFAKRIRLMDEWIEIWAVRLKRRDRDWSDAGFRLLERVGPPPLDLVPRTSHIGIGWDELVEHLETGTNPYHPYHPYIDDWDVPQVD